MMKLLLALTISILTLNFANPNYAYAEPTRPVDTLGSRLNLTYSKPLQSLTFAEPSVYAPLELKMPTITPRALIPGNSYYACQCTWYSKNRRMDLPNNLGNADTWYANAQAQGIPVGTSPKLGAVGMTKAYMHVVYIENIDLVNNTVTISEMNYKGPCIVSSRVAPASEFLYIY